MFSFFKGKSELEKLDQQYKKLLQEAHKLSTSNRSLSDQKVAQANEVLAKMQQLKPNK